MDTSAEYIKMCDDASEVQELRPENDFKSFYWSETLFNRQGAEKTVICWLPRQDQLQEMIRSENLWMDLEQEEGVWSAAWSGQGEIMLRSNFASMEQLWLAVVMHECYNKAWSTEKEEWVSQSKLPAQNADRSG